MAGNKPGSGFYAGATNEALIVEIQKIAKEKPDVVNRPLNVRPKILTLRRSVFLWQNITLHLN